MILNELFESSSKHIAFCFGRMNPPTIGHGQVLSTISRVGGDYKIFLSQTQDKKKNPLDYSTKIKFLKLMFPKYAGAVVEDTNLNTIGKVCSYLYDQGYRHVTLVAGSDRLESMLTLIKDYNGVEGKAHGFYKFETMNGKSSGDRDPDGEGVSGVSASNARAAAANGNLEDFVSATGAGTHAKALFNAVRQGMGIKDEIEEGWKEKLAGAALAGSMALGMGGNAQAHNLDNFSTAYLQKVAAGEGGRAMVSIDDAKAELQNRAKQQTSQQSAPTKTGFSKTYLQSVVDGSHPRPLISKEKAQELLNQLNKDVTESPIEMDPSDPMDPMIYSHAKANPAKLKYRMLRASGQLKDLAARAENASPQEWEIMARQFEELKMNMEQIRHALEELGKVKRKGGIRSRGITV